LTSPPFLPSPPLPGTPMKPQGSDYSQNTHYLQSCTPQASSTSDLGANTTLVRRNLGQSEGWNQLTRIHY